MISFTGHNGLEVDKVLSDGGIIAARYEGFESRQQQIEMAKAVKRAFDNNRHLAVEAGTGVGKSFAYLVSAIDQVARKKGKILVSTYTITLQEQLINKDIPFLAEILGVNFTARLAKGRGNYLCLRRLEYAMRGQKKLFTGSSPQLAMIYDFSKRTEDGSISDLPQLPSPDVWEAVRSEHGNCRGRKCPHFRQCFYYRARRELETADIIVTNHALLFSDLVLRSGGAALLPDYRYVVVDEAHNIEHVAEDHFGINITNFQVDYLLRRLYDRRRRKGLLAFTGGDEAIDRVVNCAEAAKIFFTQVQAWLSHSQEDTNGRCQPGFVDDNLTEPVKRLRASLAKIARQTEDEDQKCEFESYMDRLKGLEVDVKNFLSQNRQDSIHWVEITKSRRRRISLRSAPIDVGPDIKLNLFDRFEAVITTSATLSCGPDDRTEEGKAGFKFFADRIGLEDFDSLKLGSPFDYQRQVKMYIEADLPSPNSDRFVPQAAEAIKKYLLQTEARAFVLFTSYSMLKQISEHLADWLEENQMQPLCQGQGIDRSVLLERFKDQQTKSVLFGTESFWQGVDVPGIALSNVIIVRLPFAVPNHPLISGRIEKMKSEGKNPFLEFQLPTAIIKFKQGFGRLIRNKTDTGIVVVLDNRIAGKNYGSAFLAAIPSCSVEMVYKNQKE